MAHGLASALSDIQTDVFPFTQSCTASLEEHESRTRGLPGWLWRILNVNCHFGCHFGSNRGMDELHLVYLLSVACCPPTETHASGEQDRVTTNLPGLFRKYKKMSLQFIP